VSDFELEAMRYARTEGWSFQEIADHLGYSKTSVQRMLLMQVGRPPEQYEQVYPVNGLKPASEPTPIREGDRAVCMVSHQTGREDHPRFCPDRIKPKPEPRRKYVPGKLKGGCS
jgi:hypothetical protein